MKLITDVELAELFSIDLEKLTRLRKRHEWPFVKLGHDVRFTEEQVAQILEMESSTSKPKTALEVVPESSSFKVAGRTKRSAARKRSA